LRIFSSINAFHRHIRIGVIDSFKEAIQRGVDVKILIPVSDKEANTQIINQLKLDSSSSLPKLNIRNIHLSLQSSIGILVVDRKESLIIETKDDTSDNSYYASGLATYSKSKSIALSYASIFESLWGQSEMYEQIKIHDKMQKEFINVAAHELKTPIQPILGLIELLRSRTENREECELLDVVIRNAKRLRRLTENILDITKIESHSLKLDKEQFNLNDHIR
jgi:two-component system sensor histidine kinase VicK